MEYLLESKSVFLSSGHRLRIEKAGEDSGPFQTDGSSSRRGWKPPRSTGMYISYQFGVASHVEKYHLSNFALGYGTYSDKFIPAARDIRYLRYNERHRRELFAFYLLYLDCFEKFPVGVILSLVWIANRGFFYLQVYLQLLLSNISYQNPLAKNQSRRTIRLRIFKIVFLKI